MLKKWVIVATLACSSGIAVAQNVDKDFLKEKKFGSYSFQGCVVKLDIPSRYLFAHIGMVILQTVGEQVTLNINGEKYSSKSEGKDEFVKEFIYRQNYCSFIR